MSKKSITFAPYYDYDDLIHAGWQVIVIWQCNLTKQKLDPTMQSVAVTLNHNLLKILK